VLAKPACFCKETFSKRMSAPRTRAPSRRVVEAAQDADTPQLPAEHSSTQQRKTARKKGKELVDEERDRIACAFRCALLYPFPARFTSFWLRCSTH
jgi:hypothetical protein